MPGLVRRLLVLAGALVVALPVTLMPASPAAAEVISVGLRCGGTQAIRCAWMHIDTTNNRIRGYGSLTDRTSGADAVAVNVCIEEIGVIRECAGRLTSGIDRVEGWSPLRRCINGRQYRAVVHWDWNNGTGRDTFGSVVVAPNVC